MKPELRELRQEVENLKYDKRRKCGEHAYETFKAGTRFLLHYHPANESQWAGLPREAVLVTPNFNGVQTTVAEPMLVKLFYASSREVFPRDIADLVSTHGVDQAAVLQELLVQGRITIVDIDQVMMIIRERRRAVAEEKAKKRKALVDSGTTPDTSTNPTPPTE